MQTHLQSTTVTGKSASRSNRMLFFTSEVPMPARMVILPVRCTVIKTSKGVVVISPVEFSSQQADQIKSLGPVTDIVAPSLIHHLFLKQAISDFKSAKVWGPPGCEEKMPEVKWDGVLSQDRWPHHGELDLEFLAGVPRLNEVVFIDRQSKTLITADFVFNLTKPKGWAAPLILRMLGTYKHLAVSRLEKRFMENPKAFEESVQKIMSWDFDRIVMGHGAVVPKGGKAKLRAALHERGFTNS